MKLFFHPFSGNSRRVRLVAAQLGIALDEHVVDLTAGAQRSAEHLARNPNGRVPVLDDNGFVLWESRAIMEYLCDITKGQTLVPADARGRADVHRWLFWDAAHMAPAATVLVIEHFVKARMGKPADPAEVARGEQLFHAALPILDAHLAGKQWLVGDQLSLADLSLAAGFQAAGPAKFPMDPYANVRGWLERVQALDAWKRTQVH